jgi:hypothetical protein
MKLIASTLVFIFGFTILSFAGNGERTLREKINRKIKYPTSLIKDKQEVIVTINIHVREDGKLEIQQIDSQSEVVTQSILKQIEAMHFKPTKDMFGKDYPFRFVLKVQE